MTLSVYYERFVMAEERVASAEAAWKRGVEICRQFVDGELDAYGRRTC